MKIDKKKIQIALIITGIFLILATYFFYPKIIEKQYKESITQDTQSEIIEKEVDKNIFDKVEYKGLYDFNKPFTIKAEKAYIFIKRPELVYMNDMKVTLIMNDGRIIVISSDKGIYNKVSYDCFFEENVKATDGETIILADNMDLVATKDFATIYNNVDLTSQKGTLKADKVDYDFEKKRYKISMFSDKKVKIKIIR